MKTFLFTLPLLVFLTTGCKTQKNGSSETPAPPSTTSETKTVTPQTMDTLQTNNTCRLTVSFISIGEGTDPKARENMDRVITSWQEKTTGTFDMETIPWGREGEVDFCFTLKGLNAKEQTDFVDEIKSVFEGNNLVQISENQVPRNKR
jgi:hypothetical protein